MYLLLKRGKKLNPARVNIPAGCAGISLGFSMLSKASALIHCFRAEAGMGLKAHWHSACFSACLLIYSLEQWGKPVTTVKYKECLPSQAKKMRKHTVASKKQKWVSSLAFIMVLPPIPYRHRKSSHTRLNLQALLKQTSTRIRTSFRSPAVFQTPGFTLQLCGEPLPSLQRPLHRLPPAIARHSFHSYVEIWQLGCFYSTWKTQKIWNNTGLRPL